MTQGDGNLLVTGARSLIGRRLREVVGEWPGEVRFTSRRPLSGQSLIFDLTQPESFDPGLTFATVVMCSPVWLANEAVLDRLAILGMRRLIAFSSTSRLTKAASDEPAEREVVRKLAQGEAAIIDFCTARGIAWTILRPTLIYDEGRDENVSRIAATIRKLGVFPVCGHASGKRQPVHARDLAQAALQAIPAQAAFNRTYNLGGGETLTYRQMVEQIFAAMGRKQAVISLPVWLWRAGFGAIGFIRPGSALRQNIHMAERMNADLWFDHIDATRDFGYAPGSFEPGDFTRPVVSRAEAS